MPRRKGKITKEEELRVLSIIMDGPCPLHMKEVARLAGTWGYETTERDVRMIVNAARAKGVLVGSGNEGYFKIVTPQQYGETVGILTKKAASILKALRGLKREWEASTGINQP